MIFKRIISGLLCTTIMSQSLIPTYAMETPQDRHTTNNNNQNNHLNLEVSERQLLALNPCFAGKEELSLLNGLLICKSGVLANVRFHGLYDGQNPTYLTHPAITHPHGHATTSAWDSPQDYTSSLLQQFFPSPAGGTLLLPGMDVDLFKIVPVEILSVLLKLYAQQKKASVQNPETQSYEVFKLFFGEWFKKWPHRYDKSAKAAEEKSWSLNNQQCRDLDIQWHSQLTDPAHTYAILFSQGMQESSQYPKNLIESALLALIWKRLNLIDMAPKAPEALLDCVTILCNEQSWNDATLPLNFSKDYYAKWKENAENENGLIKPNILEDLLNSPEDLVYLTLLTDLQGPMIYDNQDAELSTAKNFFEFCFKKIFIGGRKKQNQFNKLKKNASLKSLSAKSLFSQCLKIAGTYPKKVRNNVLIDLAWKKMCAQKIAKKTSSNLMIQLCDAKIRDNTLDLEQFSKEAYMDWKKEALDPQGSLKAEALDKLLANPEQMAYLTLMYDVYDNPYPQMLGTGEAIYRYKEGELIKEESFSDCGEASLLSFLNMIIGNFQDRKFEIEKLLGAFPKAAPNFIEFYQITQPIFEKVNDSLIGRSAWADVVSGLNDGTEIEALKIVYRQAGGRCNIAGVGLDNMIRVLGKILGESFIQMFPEEVDANKRRAQIFSYLLNKLSFLEENSSNSESETESSEDSEDEVGLSWYIKENDQKIKDSLPNFSDIIIRKDGKDLFKWYFGAGHFQFDRANSSQDSDWRRFPKFDLFKKFIESSLPENLKANLLPFYGYGCGNNFSYVHSFDVPYLTYIHQQGYTKETLFSQNLGGAENKFEIMNYMLKVNANELQNLAPLWIKKLPNDNALNRMIVAFIFEHKDFFTQDVWAKMGSSIKNRYDQTLYDLENNITCTIFEEIFSGTYSKNLLKHLYDTLSDSALTSLAQSKNEVEQTVLHIQFLNEEWFLKFIKHGADVNALDKYDRTPFTRALQWNEYRKIQLLLDNRWKYEPKYSYDEPSTGETIFRSSFSRLLHDPLAPFGIVEKFIKFELENINNDDYDNIIIKESSKLFPICIKNKSLEMLEKILEIPMINPNIKSSITGDTPLVYAITRGEKDIALMLIKHPKIDPNLPNGSGITPINIALILKQDDVIQALLTNPKFDHSKIDAVTKARLEKL